jgi:murein DD-endopeptidase MepM/ murein hydrolase activator NlpD
MSIEKNILRILEEINESQKSILKSIVLNEDIEFSSPLDRKLIVTSGFGPRWGELHNGVDLVANAENVKSVADGKVIETAADSKLCGGKIIIKHSNGYQAGYCHMMKINVVAGQIVKRGDVIGISGGGLNDPGKGRTQGRHLHFTLRKNDVPVDPMKFLDKEGIISTSSLGIQSSEEDDDNFITPDTVIDTSPDNGGDFEFADIKKEERIEKNILRIFENINLTKSSLKEISSESEELFGGKKLKIPIDGAHKGQSGWASSNAWDIAAPIGTPVYALADGVVMTFKDYGSKVIRTGGKKLFGQGFTVKSDFGLPNIYYTHLEGSSINKGDKIKCGQLLGYITDFPDSSYDHLHVGVETGNIRQFLNDDGTMKCASGQQIIGVNIGDYSDESNSEFVIVPTNDMSVGNEDDFEFAGIKKNVKENIERIKKML